MNLQSSVESYASYVVGYAEHKATPVMERYYRKTEDVNDPNAGIDLVTQYDVNCKGMNDSLYFPNCVADIVASVNRDKSWRFFHISVRAKRVHEYRLFTSYADAIKYELCKYLQTEDVSFEVILDMDEEKEENNENN